MTSEQISGSTNMKDAGALRFTQKQQRFIYKLREYWRLNTETFTNGSGVSCDSAQLGALTVVMEMQICASPFDFAQPEVSVKKPGE